MQNTIRIAIETPDARVGVVVSSREAVMNTLAQEGLSFEVNTDEPLAVVRIIGLNHRPQGRLRPLKDCVPVLALR
jgi:hypothetical protein